MVIDWTSISPSNVKHPESSRSWKAVRFFHGNSYITSSRGCSLWANRMPKRLKFTVSPQISLYKQRACKIVQSQMRQISSRPKENSHMVMFTLPVGYISFFFFSECCGLFCFNKTVLEKGKTCEQCQFPHTWPTISNDNPRCIGQYNSVWSSTNCFCSLAKKNKEVPCIQPPNSSEFAPSVRCVINWYPVTSSGPSRISTNLSRTGKTRWEHAGGNAVDDGRWNLWTNMTEHYTQRL